MHSTTSAAASTSATRPPHEARQARPARTAVLAATLLVATGAAMLPGGVAAAAGDRDRTEKLTVAPDGQEGNASSDAPELSRNGRYAAFVSKASNLTPGDTNGTEDVFVRDLRTGETRRVSTAADGAQQNGDATEVSLSADGRHAAFTSTATNLTPGDTGGRAHVYVKDLRTGAIERVADAVAPGYDASGRPALSADGRYLALQVWRSEHSSEPDQDARVYRVDRATGSTVRVSKEATDRRRSATAPSISDDGSRVAYQYFVPYPSHGDWSDIHVRDLNSGRLTQVDKAPGGAASDGQAENTAMSADGRSVVFNSLDSRLTEGDTNGTHNVFVRRLTAGGDNGALRRIDAENPAAYTGEGQLSADNRYLAFVSADPADTDRTTSVYLRELRTGRTELISADTDGGRNDYWAGAPKLDEHAARVGFFSASPDLVPEDAYDHGHAYIRVRG